jgi:hypothetical protein
LNGCFGLPASRNECQVLKIVAVSYGHDAEYLERQLIDRAPYNPKSDIENVEISWQSLSKIPPGTGGTGPTVNMICNSNPPGRLSVVPKKIFQNHP